MLRALCWACLLLLVLGGLPGLTVQINQLRGRMRRGRRDASRFFRRGGVPAAGPRRCCTRALDHAVELYREQMAPLVITPGRRQRAGQRNDRGRRGARLPAGQRHSV